MKLHKLFFNRDCIGKGCCASIGENRDWVCYSDAEYNEKDELIQAEGHYRDVYIEGGLLAYCDGEYCEISGFDEVARTVTLKNDNDTENDRGRALSMRGDNAFEFTIPFEQFQADFGSFFESEFDAVYDLSNIAEIVCCRCNSSVSKSENPEYLYQCFVCDEDLYGIEVEIRKPPVVEGTTEDSGFEGFNFTDEWCAYCESVSFNIPTNRVSLCVHCGEELFPCAGCDETDDGNCSWDSCDLRCNYFNHTEAWKMKEREQSRISYQKRVLELEKIRKTDVGKIGLEIYLLNEEIGKLNNLIVAAFVKQCTKLAPDGQDKAVISRDNREIAVYRDEEYTELFDVYLAIDGANSENNDYNGVHVDDLENLIHRILVTSGENEVKNAT
jgi:hypothetical protein